MNTSSKTVGLMIEIILSTVFFAIICTVVLQLLLQAQKLEQYSRDKSGAMALAQSIGDIFRSQMSGTPQDFDLIMSRCYGEALIKEKDQHYTIYLDERMLPNKPAQPTQDIGLGWAATPVSAVRLPNSNEGYNLMTESTIGVAASVIEFPTLAENTAAEAGSPCFASVTLEEVKNISAGTMSRALIQVQKQGATLFELSVDRYQPGESRSESNPPGSPYLTFEDRPGFSPSRRSEP